MYKLAEMSIIPMIVKSWWLETPKGYIWILFLLRWCLNQKNKFFVNLGFRYTHLHKRYINISLLRKSMYKWKKVVHTSKWYFKNVTNLESFQGISSSINLKFLKSDITVVYLVLIFCMKIFPSKKNFPFRKNVN